MITVSFSGDPGELMELFSSDGFLKAISESINKRNKIAVPEKAHEIKAEVKSEPPKMEIKSAPVARVEENAGVSKELMRHAVQEYCVRMHSRYNGTPGYDTRSMVVELIKESTLGKADHTSKVEGAYVEILYTNAISDVIPETYKTILGVK